MRTSKYLLAAAVALFAGNCGIVEGSASLPVDGQPVARAASAVAPVSDEFLQRLKNLKSSFCVPDEESDEEEEAKEAEETSSMVFDKLAALFPGVDRDALYRDLELSKDPQAKLAIAFGMRERGIDVIGMYDEIMDLYQWAVEHAQGDPDMFIEEDVFNICVLLSLNIDKNIVLAADLHIREHVAHWFTCENEFENEGDFGYFLRWKDSLEEGNAQLMMHALDRSPRLDSVLFPGDCGNPNAVNAVLWKLSERCRSTLRTVYFRKEEELTLSNASFRIIEPGLSALLHGNEVLSSLKFEEVPIGNDEVVNIMRKAKTCPYLTDLDFSGCKMTDAGIAGISEELGRPGCKIESLDIWRSRISGLGVLNLARGIILNGFNEGSLYSVLTGDQDVPMSDEAKKGLAIAVLLNPRIVELDVDADFSELENDDALIKQAYDLGLIRDAKEEIMARANLERRREAEATRAAEAAAAEKTKEAVAEAPAAKKARKDEAE